MAASAGLRHKTSQLGLGSTSAPSTSSSSSTTTSVETGGAHHHHDGHHHHHHHGGAEETEALVNALKGSSDPGSRITLIGLGANVVLTGTKGAAGVVLSSASLLADAGHSLSDLLGDFVTLFCWKLARRQPTPRYPYGYGKYESLGSLIVSFFLLAGAVGIGVHSYSLLTAVVTATPAAAHAPAVPEGNLTGRFSALFSAHDHSPTEAAVDVRAAWFALLSVVVKEWLYRITFKVGKDLGSGVLMANALHHRSDAFSSVVALLAIAGSAAGYTVLDPIGGLVVSGMILKAGASIGYDAFRQLVDEVTDPAFVPDVRALVETRFVSADLMSLESARAFKSGADTLVDLVLVVPGTLTVAEAHALERRVGEAVKAEKKGVREVAVRFKPA